MYSKFTYSIDTKYQYHILLFDNIKDKVEFVV